MSITPMTATEAFVEAITSRDLSLARDLLAEDIDFRAMTPNRIWEAGGPAAVEDVLRSWLDDPQEEIVSVCATESSTLEDTQRVGWRVRGSGPGGPFVYEQQAYVRESDGRIAWLRVICSGTRPLRDI